MARAQRGPLVNLFRIPLTHNGLLNFSPDHLQTSLCPLLVGWSSGWKDRSGLTEAHQEEGEMFRMHR
jgi:hypothetical protein